MGQQLPPGENPFAEEDFVEVFWYRYWDPDEKRMATSKWMATREAIGEGGAMKTWSASGSLSRT